MTDRGEKSKTIILMASQKGGVGKSAIAIAFVGWLRRNGCQVAAYDGDAVVGTTYLTLAEKDESKKPLEVQDPRRGVRPYNLRDADEADELVNSFDVEAEIVLHDLPGGALQDLADILAHADGSGIDEMLSMIEEAGHRLIMVHVITDDVATIISLGGYLKGFGDRARHIAVLNQAFTSDDGRAVWLKSATRKRLQELGGREMEFPALREDLARQLSLSHTPWAPPEHGDMRPVVSRQLLKIFNRVLDERLNQIRDWLW